MSSDRPRRALVTGGASGLGRACALRLRSEHHDVITVDIADGADRRLDITDDEAVSKLVAELAPIDILLNSAGIVGPSQPLWETTRAEWEATFAVNVHGTVAMGRAVIPGMVQRGWGRIVNFASVLLVRRESGCLPMTARTTPCEAAPYPLGLRIGAMRD